MTPIKIQPEFVTSLPKAYIKADEVSFIGVDGQERSPWLAEIVIADLLKLLED